MQIVRSNVGQCCGALHCRCSWNPVSCLWHNPALRCMLADCMLCCAGVCCVFQNKQALDQGISQLEELHSRDLPNDRQVAGCHDGEQPVGNMLRLHASCFSRLWLFSLFACCGRHALSPPPDLTPQTLTCACPVPLSAHNGYSCRYLRLCQYAAYQDALLHLTP